MKKSPAAEVTGQSLTVRRSVDENGERCLPEAIRDCHHCGSNLQNPLCMTARYLRALPQGVLG